MLLGILIMALIYIPIILGGIAFIVGLIVFVTIMLAFVQAKFSSYMSIYGFEAAGNEEKSFFGTNMVRSMGTKIGATLAPPLVSISGLFMLPLIMSICATAHFLFCKAEKSNERS